MRTITLFFLLLLISLSIRAQPSERISTMDFVQILNDNVAEVAFYYQNNWKVLRKMAVEKGYIASYEIIETEAASEAPFHLILITTYSNKAQYKQREAHFQGLI